MQPQDNEAAEEAAWRRFVQELGEQLARAWPALQARLADRYDAFIDHAVQQALLRGISQAAGVARYVNLVVIWGPSFQDRPGFEWALGLLAAARDREWLSMHQLVRRSLAELERRPDALIDPQTLAAVDAALLDRFDSLGCVGKMTVAEQAPLPRRACDLEAVELRLPDGNALMSYQLDAGEWQRLAVPAPPPLRIALTHRAPALISVLTAPHGSAAATRLQARLRTQAVCDADHHPAVAFVGAHGLWSWRGHEARAVSWPVATLEQPLPIAGPGTAIAEETTPAIHRLDLEVCGLRDEDDALGSVHVQVWAWPSTQWWIEIQRNTASSPPAGGAATRFATRCHVEADGLAQDASGLESGFAQGLDAAAAQALQTLREAWQGASGLSQASLEGALGLLVGRAAMSWGWRLGAGGLAGKAVMGVRGQLDMAACRAELQFGGDLTCEHASARVKLHVAGDAPLAHAVRRDSEAAPLLNALLPLMASFSLPLVAELEPLAGEGGALLQAAGAVTGAFVGEAGLRPRTSGGSGWEWFARLRLEPVTLPVLVSDPFGGESARTLTLLPAMLLIDWRLG
jgi:hypothetical protein